MNVKRFTARTARDALVLVREAFGEDAVVLSTKPCDEGVAVLAMAPESMAQIDRYDEAAAGRAAAASAGRAAVHKASVGKTSVDRTAVPGDGRRVDRSAVKTADRQAGVTTPAPHGSTASVLAAKARALFAANRQQAAAPVHVEPAMVFPDDSDASVADDVDKLAMSTLSFQDYVRERMLRRRDAELKATAAAQAREQEEAASHSNLSAVLAQRIAAAEPAAMLQQQPARQQPVQQPRARVTPLHREPPVLRDEVRLADPAPAPSFDPPPSPKPIGVPRGGNLSRLLPQPTLADTQFQDDLDQHAADRRADGGSHNRAGAHDNMMSELRSMKGLIEERFGALAFMEKLQRQPAQARLTQRLLDCGFSPALIRKLSESLTPDIADETAWAAGVLERNLHTADGEPALEDQGGVYALIGATGVGKTTSTAKLAAAFATRYGAANLGLITLDAYRVGAHEQLRTYGRILGVTVHTAHDRASLEDLLDLLSAKKMVLIDTAGMAQRDSRTAELLEMMNHRSIRKLLVVNAAAQGETTEDVLIAYRASQCRGIVLSKMDEAVKLGPALDALIRHKLTVVGVANGQRVPEDWHRLSSHALVHKALRPVIGNAYRLDAGDVNIVFAAPHLPPLGSHVTANAAGAALPA